MELPSKKFDERQNGPIAYRTYIITHNAIAARWYISKGGHQISSGASLEEAKQIIDGLIDW